MDAIGANPSTATGKGAEEIAVCSKCKTPLVLTFIFPGKEFYCVTCKRPFEFLDCKVAPATAELVDACNKADATFHERFRSGGCEVSATVFGKARQEVSALCHGRHWRMTIPVREDDSDILLHAAIRTGEAACAVLHGLYALIDDPNYDEPHYEAFNKLSDRAREILAAAKGESADTEQPPAHTTTEASQ